MHKTIITLSLLIIGQFVFAQNVDLNSFENISVAAGHKVSLIESSKNYAQVEMIKGDLEDMIIEVKNNELRIKSKNSNSWFGSSTKAEIKVYYSSSLNNIDVSSGSSLSADSTIESKKLNIDISSGASCTLPLDVEDLDVEVSSGARLTLRGEAINQDVELSSGAKYSAYQLHTQYADVDASSGAKAEVHCSKKIKGDASSGAKIVYAGNPKETKIDASKYSGGSVKSK